MVYAVRDLKIRREKEFPSCSILLPFLQDPSGTEILQESLATEKNDQDFALKVQAILHLDIFTI